MYNVVFEVNGKSMQRENLSTKQIGWFQMSDFEVKKRIKRINQYKAPSDEEINVAKQILKEFPNANSIQIMQLYIAIFNVNGRKMQKDNLLYKQEVGNSISDFEAKRRIKKGVFNKEPTEEEINIAKQIIKEYSNANEIQIIKQEEIRNSTASRGQGGSAGGMIMIIAFIVAVLLAPILITLGMYGKFLLKNVYERIIDNEKFKKFRLPYCIVGFVILIGCAVLIAIGYIKKNELETDLFTTGLYILFLANILYFIVGIVVGNILYKKQLQNPQYNTNETSTSIVTNAPVFYEDNTVIETEDQEEDKGEYIVFGKYPQKDVTNIKREELRNHYKELPSSENTNGWNSLIQSKYIKPYIWYKDVCDNKGDKYRLVYFARARDIDERGTTGYSYQNWNEYTPYKVYIFKFQDLRWETLKRDGDRAVLLTKRIIDSQPYNMDGKTNNYASSTIRTWLNSDFINTAFTDEEKAKINTINVDNSKKSTNPYKNEHYWAGGVNDNTCNDTNDKVWLLSQEEVTNSAIGFVNKDDKGDVKREKLVTDYSLCLNASSNGKKGYWWLRSPFFGNKEEVWGVRPYGILGSDSNIGNTDNGVVPAIEIKL